MNINDREKSLSMHMALLENLGRNVAVARNAAGLTQAVLADKAHVSRSSIGKIESFNTEDVSLSTVAAIAEAFDFPPYLLMLGKEDWERMVAISNLHDMVEEGVARMKGGLGGQAGGAVKEPLDIGALARFSQSEKPAERAETITKIETLASKMLGQDSEEELKSVSGIASTALGVYMIPSVPILNGMIARILTKKKPHI